ncbi:MAG: aminopeptidase, partial [Deltaproteobacteria bacterium]|nr:aminopeptidase [Deltaproteobacteria bacterium]
VIALSNFSTSHTRFRSYLTRLKKVRYASMPLFERFMLEGAMTADWNAVASRTNRLVEMMTGGDTVVVTSHNGTSITFSMQRREVQPDTGILTTPGSFGNLPAGEAFLAPVEGTAEGTLILEWSPTKKLRESITLEVAKGRVVKVIGNEKYAEVLREKLAVHPLMGNIAELGIGTNDKATRPDNILETEKILGTVHIALGDNASFGGRVSVPFHQDFIFYRPTLEVIKREERTALIIDGEPQF